MYISLREKSSLEEYLTYLFFLFLTLYSKDIETFTKNLMLAFRSSYTKCNIVKIKTEKP
jgi:hypothetical protein